MPSETQKFRKKPVLIEAAQFTDDAAEAELKRVWSKIDLIRAKQAAKPKNSPLPTFLAPATEPKKGI